MIGLAVITHNRPEYLKQCLDSLEQFEWGGADYKIIIEDFSNKESMKANKAIMNKHKIDMGFITLENWGVAKAKNHAIHEMMKAGCDHIFLMEDDITMINQNTCHYYISTAKRFGVQHLNFALHGEMNKGREFMYKNMTCYPNCVGAFSYYTREVIKEVGYMDAKFKNAWEHVEHTYRIINAGYHPPFWKFADCPLNHKLLKEIPGSIDNSSIRPRKDWKSNISDGQKYWIQKHGHWLPPRTP